MAIVLNDLSGGLNTYDPPTDLPQNQVVAAQNVLWSTSRVAVRRLGTTPNTAYASGVGVRRGVFHGHRHLPFGVSTTAELYTLNIDSGVSTCSFFVADTAFTQLTPVDAIASIEDALYVHTVSAHQKCFIAYNTAVDRLHIQAGDNDPSTAVNTVRRVGLPEPAAITSVVTSGSGGTYSTDVRYFRYRYIYESGGTIWRRSEPSVSTEFTPPGTGDGATITFPALPSGETISDIEIEASDDDGDFYRIATQDSSDLTYVDTTEFATSYADDGVLSEQEGDYTPPWSAEFLVIDDDRLVIAGSFEDQEFKSRVAWTPVYAEPGVGNDERIPLDPVSFTDIDSGNGGNIVGMVGPINGIIYLFKDTQIHKLVRTNNRQRAYISMPISKTIGAVRRSMVEGTDETGAACVYFLDPNLGAHRVGQFGLQYCGQDIFPTWETVNLSGNLPVDALYVPNLGQVWWTIAVGAELAPTSTRLVLNTEHAKTTETGDVRGGWAIYTSGPVRCSFLYAADITASPRSYSLVPFLGMNRGVDAANVLDQAEIGSTDNGEDYRAYITTRPVLAAGTTLAKTGATNGMIVAPPASGSTISLAVSTNFGLWEVVKSQSLTPTARELSQACGRIIRLFDSLSIADGTVLQWTVGDEEASDKPWAIDRLDVYVRKEEEQK